MEQTTIDQNCKQIQECIKSGDLSVIAFLNFYKNNDPDLSVRNAWQWVGQCLVMHGWLTVNDANDFEVKS